KRETRLAIVVSLLMLGVANAQPAQLPVLKDRPDREQGQQDGELLGPAFESAAAGIALRPPVGSKTIRRGGSADDIAEFVVDNKSWLLKVSRATMREAIGLTKFKDNFGKERPGLLESTLQQFQQATPGTQVLRQDV